MMATLSDDEELGPEADRAADLLILPQPVLTPNEGEGEGSGWF